MTLAKVRQQDVAPGGLVRQGNDPRALAQIEDPGVALAIWRRRPLTSFQNWIDTLPADQLPVLRVVTAVAQVESLVRAACDIAGTPSCMERERLIGDVAALAEAFLSIMRTPYLRVRLERVTDDACKKFHRDYVTARLICTYRGVGTQYGDPGEGQAPQSVQSVPTAAPAIFRGNLWPCSGGVGIVHRSPPILGTGETRLLLVMDPIDDPASYPEEPVSIQARRH